MVWCMLLVNLGSQWESEVVETALRGRLLGETAHTYTVDFSEYAKAQGYKAYLGGPTEVSKFLCTFEK